MGSSKLRVTVLDMQPIMPAVGGGRQRLLGLYHALGSDIQCTYVGSYDWPGEAARDQQITPGLRERLTPLSDEHHAAAAALSGKLDNRTVIDLAFPGQAALSPAYMAAAQSEIAGADVVVFSHPWCYPPLASELSAEQLVVYDSQNVEAVLRSSLFQEIPKAAPLMRCVAETEFALCRRADLILACSYEDCATFHRVYGVEWPKLRTVPNGVFAFDAPLPSPASRAAAKRELGITHDTLALFLGSGYEPNNEAARYVNTWLARAVTKTAFAIVGGCGDCLSEAIIEPNVRATGIVDENRKRLWLTAADVAINPLAEGSGTSIKMFDYMAAGLPVVTTTVGARGILCGSDSPLLVTDLDAFPQTLADLLEDWNERAAIAKAGRRLVEENYAWERISPNLGMLLTSAVDRTKPRPYFSVVIPTYERHTQLNTLMQRLESQDTTDFEVIVVDQSAEAWQPPAGSHSFEVRYVHSPVKGAVAARNLGGFLARGEVIAFTDDDCEPRADWLSNARRWFRDARIVGLEGFIRSNHLDDPDWRPVTNIGCMGLGFMTANLLVRNASFQQLAGFDIAFDRPHFREDTDLGWRLQELGEVPFAPDVEVFHPAQPRSIERESTEARGKFFIKDALLLKKHPVRYAQLFMAEAHHLQTEGFWENLCLGLDTYKMEVPNWMRPYVPAGMLKERPAKTHLPASSANHGNRDFG